MNHTSEKLWSSQIGIYPLNRCENQTCLKAPPIHDDDFFLSLFLMGQKRKHRIVIHIQWMSFRSNVENAICAPGRQSTFKLKKNMFRTNQDKFKLQAFSRDKDAFSLMDGSKVGSISYEDFFGISPKQKPLVVGRHKLRTELTPTKGLGVQQNLYCTYRICGTNGFSFMDP